MRKSKPITDFFQKRTGASTSEAASDSTTSGPTASGPSASGPTASGPTASGPTASGPTASGPTASGPTASGPTASGPTASGPTASGPTASGPTASGPSASGPTASGPTALGPSALRPTALGPSVLRPTALGPSALGPSALRPTALGPSALRPTASGPSALRPTASVPSALRPTASGPSAIRPTASGPIAGASPTTSGLSAAATVTPAASGSTSSHSGPRATSSPLLLQLDASPTASPIISPVPAAGAAQLTTPETSSVEISLIREDSEDLSSSTSSVPAKRTKRCLEQSLTVVPFDQIMFRKNEWCQDIVECDKSSDSSAEKRSHKRNQYDSGWMKMYPWLLLCKEDGGTNVYGLLCRTCRELVSTRPVAEVNQVDQRAKGRFINFPISKWSHASQKLWAHEFGDYSTNPQCPSQKDCKGDPGKARRLVLSNEKVCCTPHYRWIEEDKKRAAADEHAVDIVSVIKTKSDSQGGANRAGMVVLVKLVLKMIHKRESLMANFKEEVDFLAKVECPALATHLSARYCSPLAIYSFVEAIYYATVLGLYTEMRSGCQGDEETTFGVLLDLASTSRLREWFALALRYPTSDMRTPERLITVTRATAKTGSSIMKMTEEAVADFNSALQKLYGVCPFLFSGAPKLLHLKNCTSYASDGGGGVRSASVSCNCRIKKDNTFNIDRWCGSHRGHLASKHASQATPFLVKHHRASVVLQNLCATSAEVDSLLKQAQMITGEADQFAAKKPTSLCDRPMFKWESEYDHLSKVFMIPQSLVAFLNQLVNDLRSPYGNRAKSLNLSATIGCGEHFLYVGFKLDIMSAMVCFIRHTEQPDLDLEGYRIAVRACLARLSGLYSRDGQHYRTVKANLAEDGKWHSILTSREASDIPRLVSWTDKEKKAAVDAFVFQMKKYHSVETMKVLDGFKLFSIEHFRTSISTCDDLEAHGEDELRILARFLLS